MNSFLLARGLSPAGLGHAAGVLGALFGVIFSCFCLASAAAGLSGLPFLAARSLRRLFFAIVTQDTCAGLLSVEIPAQA